MSELLFRILYRDASNTEDVLEALPKRKSELKTIANYKFLRDLFEAIGLPELAAKAQKVLNDLEEEE